MSTAIKNRAIAFGLRTVSSQPPIRDRAARGLWNVENIRKDIACVGLEVEKIIKSRGDSKTVALIHHPQWGRCVYKGYPAQLERRKAHAHAAAMRLIRKQNNALFPKILEVGDFYSIEEFVPGLVLQELDPDDWLKLDLENFVDRVRDFSISGSGALLPEHELRHIIHYYVHKAIHDISNQRLLLPARAAIGLFLRSRQLQDLEKTLLNEAHLALEGGLALYDLNIRNVIIRQDSGVPCVIDFEDVGRGHYLFDLAWFISHAARIQTRSRVFIDSLERAARRSFGLAETAPRRRFLRTLLKYFLLVAEIRWPTDANRYLSSEFLGGIDP